MTYQTPCEKSDTPDDWFLSRDGKQYADDDFLTQDERDRIAKSVLRRGPHESDFDHETRVDAAIRQAEASRKRKALQARRHAKEACHECYFRTACLDRALDEGQSHGTWGGYYEEELRQIRTEIARRKRRK